MAALIGTYQFDSQDNYVEYLLALGATKAQAEATSNNDEVRIGPIEGDKISLVFNDKPISFTLNKEELWDLGSFKKKATVTLNGDVLTIKTKLSEDGSLIEDKVLTPTASGLVLSISNTLGGKAERRYKRI